MALLQVLLPHDWPAAPAPLRWRLTDGVTTRTGESALDSLLKGADVELIVPAGRVLLTRVKLPPSNAQKLSEIASYAAEDKLLGDPETIHAAVGHRGVDGSATAAIIDRTWLAAMCNRFSASGRRPIRAVSEIALVPFTPGAWDLIWHGTYGWLRTADDQGLVVDAASGVPLALLLAVQEARNMQALPERLVVHAADKQALPDLPRWQRELELPVEAGSPWSWQEFKGSTQRGINLLQGAFSPSRSGTEMLARYRVPAMLAAVIAGVYFIFSVADWAWLSWQKYALQAQMLQTFKTVFPTLNDTDNAALLMQRKIAELKRARGQAQPGDFLPLLADALPALNATGGTAQAVQYERGKLQLDLRLPQVQSQQALNQRLSEANIRAKVESVNPTANGALARITFSGDNS